MLFFSEFSIIENKCYILAYKESFEAYVYNGREPFLFIKSTDRRLLFLSHFMSTTTKESNEIINNPKPNIS